MCLIIASPTGKVPEQELINNAWNDNPHGWGIMTAEGGKVRVQRGLDRESMVRAVDNLRVKARPYVIHYRWATHGEKNLDNCHPFKVQSDLYMAHNGIIKIDCHNKKRSDTWHFAQVLKRERWNAHHLLSQANRNILSDTIGLSNKLVFLDGRGNVSIVNEKEGLWHTPEIWLSNEFSLPQYQYFWNRFRNYTPKSCDYCSQESEKPLVKICNEYVCETCLEFLERWEAEDDGKQLLSPAEQARLDGIEKLMNDPDYCGIDEDDAPEDPELFEQPLRTYRGRHKHA